MHFGNARSYTPFTGLSTHFQMQLRGETGQERKTETMNERQRKKEENGRASITDGMRISGILFKECICEDLLICI